MFNDGLPEGPRYALGIIDTDDDNEPTNLKWPELKYTDTEVDSFNGWPFYDGSSHSSDSNLTISLGGVTIRKSEPEPTVDEDDDPEYVDYMELLRQEEEERAAPNHDKIIPNKKVPEDIPSHIKVDNLVDIPEEELDQILENTKGLTERLSSILLNEGAASIMAFESTKSYAEAALRDGLGVSGTIDDSIPNALIHVLRLSVLCECVNSTSIPEKYKTLFLSNLTKMLATATNDSLILSDKATKARSQLQAAVRGRVKQKQSDQQSQERSSIGVGQAGSNRRLMRQPKKD